MQAGDLSTAVVITRSLIRVVASFNANQRTTADTMNPGELPEEATDAGFLREMIGYAAQRIKDVKVDA